MRTIMDRPRDQAHTRIVLLVMALLSLTGCVFFSFGLQDNTVDLDSFTEMAKSSACADIHNRLFLIDDQFVFWDVAGNCADASYSQVLYDSSPEQVLCRLHDSIAGPMKECQDEGFQEMFDIITANLDKPDLGLGEAHTVQAVPF